MMRQRCVKLPSRNFAPWRSSSVLLVDALGLDDQPVSEAELGANVVGPRRIGFELSAQAADVDAQRVRGIALRPPHLVDERGVGNETVAVARKGLEQAVLER